MEPATVDADAAFDTAYAHAHAEDDYPMIQGINAASPGQLGMHKPSRKALATDFYAGFADVEAEVVAGWEGFDPHLKEVFQAYAEGLNWFAYHHPEQADPKLLPFDGKDIARGFVHKLPLMLNVDKVLKALGDDPSPGEPVFPGSNSHAVAPWRSTDGITRLNINSHQPWEGPVAWYEVHVHSEEGWNMVGAAFPGAPLILHGHNENVGWAMTVNRFDAVDVYALEIQGDTYKHGDVWVPFEERTITLPIDTPWGVVEIPQTLRRTVQGPVFEQGERPYAVRWSSMGQGLDAAAQWFAMNKARSVNELQDAMSKMHMPMFNLVYADVDHIGFVYNGRIPDRTPGHDYTTVLDGNDPALLWTEMLPYLDLPQVVDPASGFVQACNSTPWLATTGPEAPDASTYAPELGIESKITNRTARTLELLASGEKLSRDDFLALKWDRSLSADSPMRRRLLGPLAQWSPRDPDLEAARQALLAWDGTFHEDRVGAALAVLAWQPRVLGGHDVPADWTHDKALTDAVAFLKREFGRVDVPLGEVQRLRRGELDLPLGGGPDILNCTYTKERDGRMVGYQGDSYVMLVEFHPDGVRSSSIHQYGSSSRPESPHYGDQAPLFVKRFGLVLVFFQRAELERFLEADYAPGEAWTAKAIDPEATLAEALEILPVR